MFKSQIINEIADVKINYPLIMNHINNVDFIILALDAENAIILKEDFHSFNNCSKVGTKLDTKITPMYKFIPFVGKIVLENDK